ncbi:unnamed protein product [Cyprideis torosa]|uniref:Uncharacterized protein n=1 Tax=Cyprideis torosa TaxID=163714 RepID=A0A7R8WK75_9CRUS|nr:unnamed protein product [Cyprideis torosa]CAG0901028.1 unnamed protein product [Cyprideis torosa]
MDHSMEISALGRPFGLGMLYDCRSEKRIAGITLWSRRSLEENIVCLPQEYSNADVILEDTIKAKTEALNVSGELKLSLLAGMIDISGSGYYFKDSTSNSEVQRVTFKYETMKEAKHLTMDLLGPKAIEYPHVFDQNSGATHVVTMIEYGADAYFVFERRMSKSESKNVTSGKGSLEASVRKVLIGLSAQASGASTDILTEEEKEIKCKFYGDFRLNLHDIPTSLEDAVKIVKKLPQIIRDCGAVPKKVSLYPLCLLDRKAARLVRQISDNLIDRVQQLLQSYQDQLAKVGTFLEKQKEAEVQIPFIIKDTEGLNDFIKRAMTGLQKDILPIIQEIRGGGKEEIQLTKLLQKWESSCVSPKQSEDILETIQTTSSIVQGRVKKAKEYGVRFLVGEDFLQVLADNEKVLLFELNSFLMASKKLEVASNSLFNNEIQAVSSDPEWHSEKNVREFLDEFDVFLAYSKCNQKTRFIMTEKRIESNPSAVRKSVHIRGLTEPWKFPSAPGKPFWEPGTESGTTSITIGWAQPEVGAENVTGYVISCYDASNERKTGEVEVPNRLQTTVENLRPFSGYHFEVQCQSEAGVSPPSQKSDAMWTEVSKGDTEM